MPNAYSLGAPTRMTGWRRATHASPASIPLLPIAIGVCGHRTLKPGEIPILERGVDDFFDSFQRLHPDTPIWLLIAEETESERLVLRVFRARFRDRWRHRVLSVREDDDARADGGLSAVPEDAAAMLARHSHILLALWDGIDAPADEGFGLHPAQLARWRLHGAPLRCVAERSPLSEPEYGPVYRIHATGPSAESPPIPLVGRLERRLPRIWGTPAEASRTAAALTGEVQRFNREVVRLARRAPERVDSSRNALLAWAELPEADAVRLSEGELPALAGLFAVADALAEQNGRRMRQSVRALFVGGFVVLTLNQLFTGPLPWAWVLQVYIVLVVLGFCGGWWVRARGRYEQRYTEYRALAEGLRVLFFWRVCGIGDSVADAYLPGEGSEGDWARRALRLLDLWARTPGLAAREAERDVLLLVRREWVRGQQRYFQGDPPRTAGGAIARNDRRDRFWNRCAVVPLSLGLLAFLVMLGSPHLVVPGWLGMPKSPRGLHASTVLSQQWAVFVSSVLLALAALTTGYANVIGFGAHAKRYRRIARRLATADRRLDEALEERNYAWARRLLAVLGRAALEENEAWVTVRRDRPSEFPLT